MAKSAIEQLKDLRQNEIDMIERAKVELKSRLDDIANDCKAIGITLDDLGLKVEKPRKSEREPQTCKVCGLTNPPHNIGHKGHKEQGKGKEKAFTKAELEKYGLIKV